jgi:hypothetical protein
LLSPGISYDGIILHQRKEIVADFPVFIALVRLSLGTRCITQAFLKETSRVRRRGSRAEGHLPDPERPFLED